MLNLRKLLESLSITALLELITIESAELETLHTRCHSRFSPCHVIVTVRHIHCHLAALIHRFEILILHHLRDDVHVLVDAKVLV